MMSIRHFNEDGFITARALFWLIVFVAAAYGGYKFVPPYFSYYMMKNEVGNEAKVAHMYTDERVAQRIMEKAETWSVPLDIRDIEILREQYDINIRVRYTVVVNLAGRYKKYLHFDIQVRRPLKETSRILE